MATKKKEKNIGSFDIQNLKSIADIVASTFGKYCEVVIHDFSDLDHSLIYITGDVTKRKPGAPITDLVLKEWKREGNGVGDLANYKTITRDGKVLKSSTAFLRDMEGKIVGAFCINFDVTQFLDARYLIKDFSHVTNLDKGNIEGESFSNTVDETIESLIDQAINQVGKQLPTMQREDKIAFIGILEKKGTFLIKGAVSYVAALLGVSKFTIYNYLQKAKSIDKLNFL